MDDGSLLTVVWRRKWIVVASIVICAVTAGVIASAMQKVYRASADLVVAQEGTNRSFDAVQAAQVAARSYATVLTSESVLSRVGGALGVGDQASELAGVVGASAVAETQLIRITAEDPSPRQAQVIAATHARVFIDYATAELTPTTGVGVRLVAAPSVPATPFRPQPRVYIMLAALLGLGAGIGLALLRERTDPRIRTSAALRAFGLPVLARLPAQGSGAHDPTVVEQAMMEDAFRLLYVRVQHVPGRTAPRTLAVAALPDAVSTPVVVGLARATAGADGEVIVVDAGDSPERAASAALGVQVEASPALHARSDDEPAPPVLRPSAIAAIWVVDAGDTGGALSVALESPVLATVVAELTERSDLVIWDCPKSDAGADIAAISAHVDGVVIVVDLQTARRHDARALLDGIAAVGGQPLGFVVDGARPGARDAAGARRPASRASRNGRGAGRDDDVAASSRAQRPGAGGDRRSDPGPWHNGGGDVR